MISVAVGVGSERFVFVVADGPAVYLGGRMSQHDPGLLHGTEQLETAQQQVRARVSQRLHPQQEGQTQMREMCGKMPKK